MPATPSAEVIEPEIRLLPEGWRRNLARHQMQTDEDVASRTNLSPSQVYRVRTGRAKVGAKFIREVLWLLNDARFEELFEVTIPDGVSS